MSNDDKVAIAACEQAAMTLGFEQAILLCIGNDGRIVASSWGANMRKCDGLLLADERKHIEVYGNAIVPEVASRFIQACM